MEHSGLLDKQLRLFIIAHKDDDVNSLALQASKFSGIDFKMALQQIQGYQIAKRKIPLWTEYEDTVFPPHISLEQCSSQTAAEYKLQVAMRITDNNIHKFADLTGGFAVDATVIARETEMLTYVETQEDLCRIVDNNLRVMGVRNFHVINAKCEDVIENLDYQDVILIDPARRDGYGRKVVSISDCSPDIGKLQNEIISKTRFLMVKLSPMLDISSALKVLNGVDEVHVVAIDNECKEVLIVMQKDVATRPKIICADISRNGKTAAKLEFYADDEKNLEYNIADYIGRFIYDPNSAIMKAGAFKTLSHLFPVHQLDVNTHVYTSDAFVENFPGRSFIVEDIFSFSKNSAKLLKKTVTAANVCVRNIPISVSQFRKRFYINEGGDSFLFVVDSLAQGKVILKCKRI